MFAFIKHIKTSMLKLPPPTQIMGYKDFDEMKESGHYKKLLDQFKEKIINKDVDSIFKLRKMLNRVATDKQISRVSELEKRDYGIRYIAQNSRKLDKIVRSLNTYLDEATQDESILDNLGVSIKLIRSNTKYNVRLRNDMDSRERIDGIPSTLNSRTTYDRASQRNRGFSKYVSLSLPLYIFRIKIITPTMDVSDGMQRGEQGNDSFKVPIPWDLDFMLVYEIGKFLPKLLIEDFVLLDEMENYTDLLNYIHREMRSQRDGEHQMASIDYESGDSEWDMSEEDSGLIRQHYYNRHRSTDNTIIFTGVTGYHRRPRYPHPFIANHDTATPCWAGWREELDKARKNIDVRRLAFLIKGWATIYNQTSHPHHNISNFMLGLPQVAKDRGWTQSQVNYECWEQHENPDLCDEIECALRNSCEAFISFNGKDNKVEPNVENDYEETTNNYYHINGIKINKLSPEEKERLMSNNNQGGNNE